MAIDRNIPSLQRPMFGAIPGVDPRLVGVDPEKVAGGIYNLRNMGGAPPPVQPVAAQPIQVASRSPSLPAMAPPAAPPAVPLMAPPAVAARPLSTARPAVSPEAVLGEDDDFQTLYDSTTALIEKGLAEGEDVTELLETRSRIVQRAAEAGEELVGPEDEGGEAREEDVVKVTQAATEAAAKTVDRGEISGKDASEAIRKAKTQVDALTSKQDMTFKDHMKAVGLENKNYDSENYNAKAKELLGLDSDEADVPEWAAPIFLFGLNLMKAPASKETSDTGLTGFLADIGAAGEVGFAGFGKERERRRKQRASVATLASQLRTQDLSLRKQAFSEYMELNKFNTDLKNDIVGRHLDFAKIMRGVTNDRLTAEHRTALQADSKKRTANSATRAMNSTRSYLAAEQKNAMTPYMKILENNPKVMAQFAQAFKAEESKGVDPNLSADDQLAFKLDRAMAPGYYASLAAIAAREAGITPAVELTTIDFQKDKFSYDPIEVSNYVTELNKQRAQQSSVKGLKPLTVTQVLNEALSDPKSPHRRMIIGSPKTVIKTDPRTVEGVTTERYINENARNKWFETNPQPTDLAQTAAYAAKVKAAESQWLTVGDSYIEGKPEFKEQTYTNKDGVKVKYYIDDFAFDQRRKSQRDLTMQDVLLDPDKYPRIIQGKITDYSGIGGKIDTITVYDKGMRRALTYDKVAYKNALDNGTLTEQDGLAGIIEQGIGRFVGKGVTAKPTESILTLSADGSLSHIKAQDAKGVMAAFSSKKDQTDWRNRTTSIINLNASAWDIRNFLQKGNALGLTTRGLDWAASAKSLSRLIKTQLGYNQSAAISTLKGAVTDSKTRSLLDSALASFDKPGTTFAGNLIKDKTTRGQIKSTFLNLAFGLASAREGGKLTDNDVRNALQTLGWDGTSWTQTPEEVLGTLSNAVKDANNKYLTEASLRLGKKEYQKLEKNLAEGKPGYIETMLRKRAKLGGGGAMYEAYSQNKGDPGFILQFDINEGNRRPTTTDGTPPRVSVTKGFKVNQISRDDLGIMGDKFSGTRIPNQHLFAHREMFKEPTDETKFITYESVEDFKNALKNRIVDIYGGKDANYKHNDLTARQLGEKFLDYEKYLFKNDYFR
jgi:hypothetical protein